MTRELRSFLLVGGTGYVVDVVAFNLLRATMHPGFARTGAVLVAMCVTYAGNRLITWRGPSADRRREVALFVVFNAVGYALSLLCLLVSHDLLRLTSALADNVSANVVGVGLGTVFRFITYRSVVFASPEPEPADRTLVPCG